MSLDSDKSWFLVYQVVLFGRRFIAIARSAGNIRPTDAYLTKPDFIIDFRLLNLKSKYKYHHGGDNRVSEDKDGLPSRLLLTRKTRNFNFRAYERAGGRAFRQCRRLGT